MLQTLHRFMRTGKPIYGMHRGTVGFLMNEYSRDDLMERLEPQVTVIHPLLMRAHDEDGDTVEFHAINEVSLPPDLSGGAAAHSGRRQGTASRTGRRRRADCDAGRLDRLQSFRSGPDHSDPRAVDGLTPISPFRPRRWRGALLPDTARVRVEVLEPEKRPVAAVADHDEVRSVSSVNVRWTRIAMHMLFDPGHSLDERILREQFGY